MQSEPFRSDYIEASLKKILSKWKTCVGFDHILSNKLKDIVTEYFHNRSLKFQFGIMDCILISQIRFGCQFYIFKIFVIM